MSKVIIPISVELGNSLTNIDKVTKKIKDTATEAAKPIKTNIDAGFSDAPFTSIKTQLREANIELQNLVAQFGAASPQVKAAAERVAELRDVIEDSGRAAETADLDDRFRTIGAAVAGLASAFQGAVAIQGLFGEKSKETEEALKKVQAAMALTQAITGIFEGVKAFKQLAAQVINSTAVTKIYSVSQVAAAAVTRAFGGSVVATSFAFKGLAVAIASTGIGLLIVGLGVLIPKLVELFTSTKNAAGAINNLSGEEKSLADAIENTNRLINDRNNALDFATQKAVLQAKIAGKSQEDINAIEAAGREKGLAEAKADRDKANNLFLATQKKTADSLATIILEGSDEEINKARETRDKILSDLKDDALKKKAVVTKLENDIVLTGLQIQADGADKQNKQAADKQKELAEKLKQAKTAAGKILTDLDRRNASDAQQAIFKVQDEYAEKRKTLAQAGIKDFTKLNQAEKEEILAIETASNNSVLLARQNLEKALFNLIVNSVKKRKDLEDKANALKLESRNLAERAELSAIKDSGQRRIQELTNAENKEQEDLEKKYAAGLISLDKFLSDQLAIEQYYANEKAGVQTDSQKKTEEELKAFQEKYTGLVESGLEDALEALGTAIGEGEDPFAALAKSIGNSLANFVTSLGKDMVKLGTLFEILSKALNKLQPPGLKVAVGLALIAFGAAIKSSINKKSANKFASGGFVSGPGTETSDSIPARLSKGEYVIKARSVRKYGPRLMEKINNGEVTMAALARAVDPSRALVNRNDQQFLESLKTRSRAIVNRNDGIELFSEGGLVTDSSRGTSRALVNRFEMPEIVPYDKSRAIVNRSAIPDMNEAFNREVPYIATTKVSGQDLKIILERADRRYSNAT